MRKRRIFRVIKTHITNDEIQRKLFDDDMAKDRVEREKTRENIHESTETSKAVLEKLNEIERLLVDRLR